MSDQFGDWLTANLQKLQLDEEVYHGYICGILEEEEQDREELAETVTGILAGVLEEDVEENAALIINKWFEVQNNPAKEESAAATKLPGADNDDMIRKIIEKQQQQVVVQPVKKNSEDGDLKSKMLDQYAQYSDEETDEGDSSDDDGGAPLGFVNTNAQGVADAENAKKEKAKAASDAKKIVDKQNREHQANKKDERKEKEKLRTAKGERKSGR